MTFDREQRSIVGQSVVAVALGAAVLSVGYVWLPAERVGVKDAMDLADRLAYTLKWELPIILWLAGCIQAVSRRRFWSASDRKGSAGAEPSPAIAVRRAVLQNSLEQTALAFGALLILATVLRGPELVLVPLIVLLYLVGRATFAAGYARDPIARAFGMALTAAPLAFAIGLAAVLIVTGR